MQTARPEQLQSQCTALLHVTSAVPGVTQRSSPCDGRSCSLRIEAITGQPVTRAVRTGSDSVWQMKAFTDQLFLSRITRHLSSQLLRVDNDGPQVHDLTILRVLPGKTEADVDKWLFKPDMRDAPVEAMGGAAGIARWAHTEFAVDIKPGNYLILCIIPDRRTARCTSCTGCPGRSQ